MESGGFPSAGWSQLTGIGINWSNKQRAFNWGVGIDWSMYPYADPDYEEMGLDYLDVDQMNIRGWRWLRFPAFKWLGNSLPI